MLYNTIKTAWALFIRIWKTNTTQCVHSNRSCIDKNTGIDKINIYQSVRVHSCSAPLSTCNCRSVNSERLRECDAISGITFRVPTPFPSSGVPRVIRVFPVCPASTARQRLATMPGAVWPLAPGVETHPHHHQHRRRHHHGGLGWNDFTTPRVHK